MVDAWWLAGPVQVGGTSVQTTTRMRLGRLGLVDIGDNDMEGIGAAHRCGKC